MATTPAAWFQRVMWAGIIANLALAVPTLLWPAQMQALARLPAATPLVWVRFSSLLLILLSSFYVPAAVDCRRHRTNAWLATGGRLAGVTLLCAAGARVLAVWRLRLRIFSAAGPPPDEDGKACGVGLVEFSPWCW